MITIFAHRGASDTYPENTLSAFQEAIRVGTDAIEFDVQLTRDHRLAIFHDETLERMANLSTRVADMTLEEMQEVNIPSQNGKGEHIPSLREVLEELPQETLLNIHAIGHAYDRDMLATKLVELLDEQDAWKRGFVASDAHTLKMVRRLCPDAEVCCLTRFPNPSEYLRHSVGLGCHIIQPLRQMVSRELVDEAHRQEVTVNVVYANTEEEMQELIDMGVDGILTSKPGLLRNLLTQ